MDTRAYILDLLSRGAAPADVARIASCSPSYISQLQGEADFAQELAEKRAFFASERDERAQKTQKIHDSYLALEETLLDSLSQQAKARLLRPIEQMKLLQIVGMKKEPASVQAPVQPSINVVTQISLPAQIAQQFVLNEQKEIIGMEDGRSFAPMNTKALQELAKQRALPAPKPQLAKTEDIMRMFTLGEQPTEEIKI